MQLARQNITDAILELVDFDPFLVVHDVRSVLAGVTFDAVDQPFGSTFSSRGFTRKWSHDRDNHAHSPVNTYLPGNDRTPTDNYIYERIGASTLEFNSIDDGVGSFFHVCSDDPDVLVEE